MLWSVWFLCSLVYRLRVTFEKQSSAASDLRPGTSCAAQPFSVQCCSLQVGQKGCLDHRSTYPQEILAREFDGWRLEKDHHWLRMVKKYCLFPGYRCFIRWNFMKFLKNRSSPSIDAFHIFLQPPKDYQDVNSTLTPFCTAPRWVRVKRRVSGERHWHFWKRWRRKVWRCATGNGAGLVGSCLSQSLGSEKSKVCCTIALRMTWRPMHLHSARPSKLVNDKAVGRLFPSCCSTWRMETFKATAIHSTLPLAPLAKHKCGSWRCPWPKRWPSNRFSQTW